MGLRGRLAGGSDRRVVIVAIAGVAVAAVVAASIIAIVRSATSSTPKPPTPASLGVTSGGPDHPGAAAAVATFAKLMHVAIRQPAQCSNLNDQYHVIGPHIWLFRTQLAAFLRSADGADVHTVEAALNQSPDVAYWVYEPPSAVLAEAQRTSTCSATVPKAAIPATFRIALTSKDPKSADALSTRLSGLAPVSSTSCSGCSGAVVQPTPTPTPTPSPGSMGP